MAGVTAELLFEVLKSVQARVAQVDGKIDELKQQTQASRTSQNGIRQEITSVFQEVSGIHATLVRHEGRLDRIERRLELNDAPTLT
jgi:septal ring factor EnvC (AmiA/AmiB activator)